MQWAGDWPARRVSEWAQPQPQAPPQQPPPARGAAAAAIPVIATVDSSLTVSSWPTGQVAGSLAALIGRVTSKVAMPPTPAQARQRNSYRGTRSWYRGRLAGDQGAPAPSECTGCADGPHGGRDTPSPQFLDMPRSGM